MKLTREYTDNLNRLPIKVLQFGEGNFLRAFVEYAFQKLNQEVGFNAGIAVVQPIAKGMVTLLNDQDGLYTLFTKGIKNGKEVEEKELITNIVKGVDPYANFEEFLSLGREESLEFIISNTTEAGIAFVKSDRPDMKPPSSFPAKLTVLLLERFTYFNGDMDKGLTIIPCELINYNSDTLKKIVLEYVTLWNLSETFKDWLIRSCTFHNTLVDRIVPGYPRDQIEEYNDQLDYEDRLIVSAETFFLWVIEGDDRLKAKLPFGNTDLDVKIVDDMQPFRTRKVRILNGAHTTMVPFSLLFGNQTVKESVEEPFTGPFIRAAVYEEIIPTLDMERDELEKFADAVFDRFRNPFIKHQLSSIALNSISKFKVRVLPSILTYIERKNELPQHLVYAFACLIRFYKGKWKNHDLPVNDDEDTIAEMVQIWQMDSYSSVTEAVLKKTEYWDADLTLVPNLKEAVALALEHLEKEGVQQGFKNFSEALK
ncbi:tagaturonate reductase [Pareuzebyella sediminis]|uniref:tagaturonate reductase n=1 Tax=Pareuzebyella sediminis TaxID=2607998 RepID=UPI0011EF9C49|nr:tagaturonate reductase [Pareuzebyella sediminis]